MDNPSIQAVFFDIDGTFFDHTHKRVLPQSLEAVRRLKERGIKVCLCSGRAIEMARQLGVLQLFPWDGYVGGAGVSIYNEQMDSIYESYYTKEQTNQIFTLGKELDICIHSHGAIDFMTKPLDDNIQAALTEFNCHVPKVGTWQGEPLTAISAYGPKGYDWSVFNQIEGIEVQQPCDTCVDFIRLDVNKATGIRKMMEYWGLPLGSYIAFGDSVNDIQMIQEATIGIVMGNATPQLKEVADMVIGDCSQPVIYETLKELKLL